MTVRATDRATVRETDPVLTDLLDAALRDPGLAELAEAWRNRRPGPWNVIGPTDSQKAFLGMALARKTGLVPCFLVSDDLRARALAEDLRAFTSGDVGLFRQREIQLTEADATSHGVERERIGVLSRLLAGEWAAVVMTAVGAMQKLPPVDRFRESTVCLSVGDRMDPGVLSERLAATGYERVVMVEGPGQYSLRGDVLDVTPVGFPGAEDPDGRGVRIGFFDDEVDSIRTFEIQGQRSSDPLGRVSVPPARELLVPEDRTALAALAARVLDSLENEPLSEADGKLRAAAATSGTVRDALRRLVRQDAGRIETGIRFAALDRWIPLVHPEAATVLDYVEAAGGRLLLDEPLRIRHRMDAATADLHERTKTLLMKGAAPPQSVETHFRSVDLFIRIDRSRRATSLAGLASSGNGLPGAREIRVQGRIAEPARLRPEALVEEVRREVARGTGVAILAGSPARADRVADALRAAGLPPDGHQLRILPRSLTQGFGHPAAGLLVLGGHDLFGPERPTRRRHAKGVRIDLFGDLRPGDLVVHEAHGIGRYQGLVNLDSGGARRDYLKIAYQGDDTLYIPMESLGQIQKYVGAEGREVRLSKLGGTEWNRMKERARESVRKLAADLVALYAVRSRTVGHRFAPDTVWQQEFEEAFPFEETADQVSSLAEIKRDMESDRIMDRILCGDVGFGKTEVAFRAMFKCICDGKQAALLSPTTVLAQQHYENLAARVEGFPVSVGLLSRFATPDQVRDTLKGLRTGRIDLVVGTHRLLSDDVAFKDLGLLVVDEEQRFGVDHKEKIKVLKPRVDVLTLSATPIPRTLHMSLSGIRDISVLEEPPHDRLPVQTYVMEYDDEILSEAMLREISREGQVFYLYNDTRRIGEKANRIAERLPGARVAFAHGQMGERNLEEIISSFVHRAYDILVCTTIIESGIDMPNVNTIVVENADRLGLAQLYQLRGRVGRSDRQAYAYVTYHRDRVLSEESEKRLSAIRDFTELGSGIRIAMRDLEVRGAGNLLGAEQSGHLDAVGYDLYCRMLEEAILEEKGEVRATRRDATVDLDLDAYIPPAYVPDEAQRMDMYRRIAAIADESDYRDVLDELMDRYGTLPPQAITLADIAFARSSAARFGFRRVSRQDGNVLLTFEEGGPPPVQTLSALMGLPAYRGQLLVNAGSRPHVLFRKAAADPNELPGRLRGLFMALSAAMADAPPGA